MSDPSTTLNLNATSDGEAGTDAEDWVRKTTALERTVRGLADGTYDVDSIPSLKEYGILSEQERAEEDRRRRREKEQTARRDKEKKEREKKEERTKWWDGAVFLYGPREEEKGGKEGMIVEEVSSGTSQLTNPDEQRKMLHRYSSDYSRWSDSSFVPDDEASRDEMAETKRQKEMVENVRFEEANKEFCSHFKEDMERREEQKRQKEESARKVRLQGNLFYKRQKYGKALGKYFEALEIEPYSLPILSNIALCHTKMQHWKDTIEYCDRVLHVSKNNYNARAKALYQRAVANSALMQEKDALHDLDMCLALDPNNEDASERRENIIKDIQDRGIETRIIDALKDSKSAEVTLLARKRVEEMADEGENARVSPNRGRIDCETLYEQVMKCVLLLRKGEEDASVQEICQITDCVVREIHRSSFSVKLSPSPINFLDQESPGAVALSVGVSSLIQEESVDVSGLVTPSHMLCFLLRHSCIARAYLRTSGYLMKFCHFASQMSKKEGERLDREQTRMPNHSTDYGLLLQIISESIKSEARSRGLVAEHGVLAAVLGVICSLSAKPQPDVGESGHLHISALALISASIGPNKCSETSKAFPLIRQHIKGIAWAISHFMDTFCKELKGETKTELPFDLENNVNERILVCKDLMMNLLACNSTRLSLRKCYQDEKMRTKSPLVEGFVRAVALCPNPSLRYELLAAILQMSTVEEFRSGFLSRKANSDVVCILLALARSHKSVGVEAREMALLSLTNVTIHCQSSVSSAKFEESRNEAVQELCHSDGLNVLVNMIAPKSNEIEPPAIKHRASGLLCQCISTTGVIEALDRDNNATCKLLKEFERITSDPHFSLSCASVPPSYDCEAHGKLAVNLIRIIAALEQPCLSSSPIVVSIVTLALPLPCRKTRGEVTAESICQPPEPLEEGSALEIAAASTSFYVNVLKVVISFLGCKRSLDMKEQRELLERVVCLLANSGRGFHPSVTKNAMIVVAKIIQHFGKDNPDIVARARELRALEMLTELGRSKEMQLQKNS